MGHSLDWSNSSTCPQAAAVYVTGTRVVVAVDCGQWQRRRVLPDQEVDVGDVLRGLLTCVRRHSVRVDVEYATLIINILCLDSMAKVSS